MESQLFDKALAGRLLNLLGYALFVFGLVAALVLALSSQRTISETIAKDPTRLWPASLVLTGFALFLGAKSSVFRRRILVSFGSARMTGLWSAAYFAGYALMILGWGLLLNAI
jgi:hypothetical protein